MDGFEKDVVVKISNIIPENTIASGVLPKAVNVMIEEQILMSIQLRKQKILKIN